MAGLLPYFFSTASAAWTARSFRKSQTATTSANSMPRQDSTCVMPRFRPITATRTRANGLVMRSCTGFWPAGRGRVWPMSDDEALALAEAAGWPWETPAKDAPTPASAEALRKLRRDKFDLFIFLESLDLFISFGLAIGAFFKNAPRCFAHFVHMYFGFFCRRPPLC